MLPASTVPLTVRAHEEERAFRRANRFNETKIVMEIEVGEVGELKWAMRGRRCPGRGTA